MQTQRILNRNSTSLILLALCMGLLSACGGSGTSSSNVASDVLEDTPITEGGGVPTTPQNDNLPAASTCSEAFDSVTITIPTTLSNTDNACDYHIRGTNRIKGELTIEPGTVILMGQDAWIVIDNGTLNAVGTDEERIVIRGEQPVIGFWQGIRLSNARASRIEHVDIMDAGNFANPMSRAQPGAITASSSTLSLVDTSISNSDRDGAHLSTQLGTVQLSAFSNNRFFGNTGKPLTISGNLLDMLDTNSDYLGVSNPNGDPVVELEYTRLAKDSYTIKAINVPYRPTNALTASAGEEITLEPGVQIDMGVSFGRITGASSGGRYNAVGTPDQPIVFMQSSSPAAEGVQSAVEARDGGVVTLRHVKLKGVTASAERDGRLKIDDASIADSPGYGIQCAPLALPIEGSSNITFDNNALGNYSPDCMF